MRIAGEIFNNLIFMIKTVTITKISRQQKQGRKGAFMSIGLQLNGKNTWVNGTDNIGGPTSQWKEGQTVTINVYEDSWIGQDGQQRTGWKFKFPKDSDLLRREVEDLKRRVMSLENQNGQLTPTSAPFEAEVEEKFLNEPMTDDPIT